MQNLPEVVFDVREVPVEATRQVAAALDAGESCVVHGRSGSGRTHAVRQAVTDQAAWLVFQPDTARTARAVLPLAADLGAPALVDKLRSFDLDGLLGALDDALGDRTLVVDGAQFLRPRASAQDVALNALQWLNVDEDAAWRDWIHTRARRCPTVVIAGLPDLWSVGRPIPHSAPSDWPVRLVDSEDGYRNWPKMAHAVGPWPDALFLARAVTPLVSADEFNRLAHEPSALQSLGVILRERAPEWARALDLVALVDGAPEPLLREMLGEGRTRAPGQGLISAMVSTRSLLDELISLRLLQRQAGRLHIAPALHVARALQPPSASHASKAAGHLLRGVVDRSRPSPDDAERVLYAHHLSVSAGDLETARSTATFHVHGLIRMAREVSLAGHHDDARRQYAGVVEMLAHHGGPKGHWLQRTYSYALHYHAWNGRQAGTLTLDLALEDARRACELWRENARWQGLRVELLLGLRRLGEAREALSDAEGAVPEHPHRGRFLRVRPAVVAIEVGELVLGLEILEPVRDTTPFDDPRAAGEIHALFQLLRDGLELEEVQTERGRLVFRRAQRVQLRELQGWRAKLPALDAMCQGDTPAQAVLAVAQQVADDARTLIGTPTPRLSSEDAERKGLLLATLDVMNSDIGLPESAERWIVGRIEQGQLVPLHAELPRLAIGEPPAVSATLWFARVAAFRDGQPRGPVLELRPVGSGRSADEVATELRRLRDAG